MKHHFHLKRAEEPVTANYRLFRNTFSVNPRVDMGRCHSYASHESDHSLRESQLPDHSFVQFLLHVQRLLVVCQSFLNFFDHLPALPFTGRLFLLRGYFFLPHLTPPFCTKIRQDCLSTYFSLQGKYQVW